MNLKSLSLLSAAGMLMSYTVNVHAQCEVKYSINSNWGSGATLNVDIINYGAPKTSWELAWNFANAEKISQLWNGIYTQTGQSVRVKNAAWNGNINTNQSINFGFNLSLPNGTSLSKPAEFSLNGTKCLGKASSSTSSSRSSSSVSSSSSSSVKTSSSIVSSSSRSSSSAVLSSSSLRSSSSMFSSSSSIGSSSSVSSSSSSVPPLANCTNDITYGPRLLRVLSRAEYSNSIRDLTGINIATDFPGSLDFLLANTYVNGFENNTQEIISTPTQRNFLTLANRIANHSATNNFSGFLNCEGLTAQQCADKFTQEKLTHIFRRPASESEMQEYRSLFNNATTSELIKQALQLALSTALSSPQFLYRQETGIAVSDIRAGNTNASLPTQAIDNDSYVLTPYELASFLSFTFTGSTPDLELLSAAQNGGLATDAAIEAEVNRLLNKTNARAHFGRFASQWLDAGASSTKLFPITVTGFNAKIDESMRMEMQEYFSHIALDGAGPFSKLLVNNYSIVNETLVNFYGLGNVLVTQDKFVKTSFPSHIRQGGLLTSGAFVASKSSMTEPTSPALALAIRNRLLCQNAYSYSVQDTPEWRDNPFLQVGFAYQNLDAGSRRRTHNMYDYPINSAGVFTGIKSATDGATIAFTNAEDLAQKISTLDAVRYCFVEHNFRAAFGTGTQFFDPIKPETITLSAAEQSDYACEKNRLDFALTSNGNSVRALLKRLGSLPAARYRKDRSQ